MLISYNWLKEYLGPEPPNAEEVAELLTFRAFEVERVEKKGDDWVLDIDVLPNRSSDCLSHRGVAREISTLTSKPLAFDPFAETSSLTSSDLFAVEIEVSHDCPRFTAALISGITVKESPAWLKERLDVLGQRSINNIVDATNYVMYALGQPLHAYDADLFPQVDGKWRFKVRRAVPGETISLLAESGSDDDRVVELKGTELLIVDGASDMPIGLAGVKGGRHAMVSDKTTKIIIEAANFDPILTRRTARTLNIVIDASKRFENELSRELPLYAQVAIAKLITDIAGGSLGGVADVYKEKRDNPFVLVRPERVNGKLGLSLQADEMVSIVQCLGATVKEDGGDFLVRGPFERTDLKLEEDYIEEIGRIHGLAHIKAVLPAKVALAEVNQRHYYSEKICSDLIEQGFSEVITSSFRQKDNIELKNALSSDKKCLRSSLADNLTEVLACNVSHLDLLGLTRVSVFEIGTVFTKTDAGIKETVKLGLGVRSRVSASVAKDDELVLAATKQLERALGCELNWVIGSGVAETDLTAALDKLPPQTAYQPAPTARPIQYQTYSVYPAVSRDLAMWVSGTAAPDEIKEILKAMAGGLCVRITLFDEFTKEGRQSYAFRLVFQAPDRTLTDSEVNLLMEKLYQVAADKGWLVR